MKPRWIGPPLMAAVVALAGCAPSQAEDDASAEPAPVQAAPSADADGPGDAPAENSGPDDYGY
jgi:hypothetical protein